jgi:hypothetical protein
LNRKSIKLQAALDYLSSYGLALIIITVAFFAVYEIALAPNNPAVYCTATPGFACNFISVNSMGVLTGKFSQALGTQITINGVACASLQSSNTDTPAYGNMGVSNTVTYYPTPTYYPPANVIYSGGYYTFRVYCYGPSGIAKGTTGKSFSGFIWLNYTIPNYGSQTQKIATFSSVYS